MLEEYKVRGRKENGANMGTIIVMVMEGEEILHEHTKDMSGELDTRATKGAHCELLYIVAV